MTGISQEVLEEEVRPRVMDFLPPRGLARSEETTQITHSAEGCDFLGHHGRQDHGKCLITPSKKNGKAFLADSRNVSKDHNQATASWLRAPLTPHIRGWANFQRHAAAKHTLVHVDMAICNALWRWARRRHPQKGQRWRKDRSFGRLRNQNWRFFGTAQDKDGDTIQHWLCLASATTINKKDPKSKGDCNPDDPAWDIYREARLGVKMAKTLYGKRRRLDLWKEQGGLCPIGTQPITQVTGWHNHPIVDKTLGGTDTAENRVLPHPNGHRQVHAQGFTVSKPRPVQEAPQAQPGAFARLELDEGKLSRPVLRAGGGSNPASLTRRTS